MMSALRVRGDVGGDERGLMIDVMPKVRSLSGSGAVERSRTWSEEEVRGREGSQDDLDDLGWCG